MINMIISYDLRNKRDYKTLIDAIQSLGSSSKVLESLWYVRTTYSAVQCRDYLKKYIDKDDGIAVFDCSNNTWATYGANADKMKSLWN
ncbi:hypothetical protein BKG95_02505 [Rodentibacter pneumotropicus]|uniref:Uncharacterized protein n=1 Tax=Rodentibacter pneumotropicus TaxID=758 RepID=A0AAW5LC51_9PAST|nr:hypothetical protein [Rodentibacter pneumotropicus]MCQ9120987.1 hypothetical protein [Rodentibacter pneumotropicus]OOF69156.1 hypothetical protein BKG95_02505 [Rodentibacter pneumotropicus]